MFFKSELSSIMTSTEYLEVPLPPLQPLDVLAILLSVCWLTVHFTIYQHPMPSRHANHSRSLLSGSIELPFTHYQITPDLFGPSLPIVTVLIGPLTASCISICGKPTRVMVAEAISDG